MSVESDRREAQSCLLDEEKVQVIPRVGGRVKAGKRRLPR